MGTEDIWFVYLGSLEPIHENNASIPEAALGTTFDLCGEAYLEVEYN